MVLIIFTKLYSHHHYFHNCFITWSIMSVFVEFGTINRVNKDIGEIILIACFACAAFFKKNKVVLHFYLYLQIRI